MADQYISAAITVLEDQSAGIPIKVSAVKAIQKYALNKLIYEVISDNFQYSFASGMDQSILLPSAMRIAKDLGPFLLATTEDTLSLVLETLSSIMDVGRATWITPELAEQLVTAMLEVWVKNNRGENHLTLYETFIC